MDSKKNSETSHPAGARDPVWNQDFHFWVEDPVQQKLSVVVRDSMAFNRDIGYVQVPIWQLQDCVPLSMWLPLLQVRVGVVLEAWEWTGDCVLLQARVVGMIGVLKCLELRVLNCETVYYTPCVGHCCR